MKKTPASIHDDRPPAAISETEGRNGTKSLVELSEIPNRDQTLRVKDPRAATGQDMFSDSALTPFQKYGLKKRSTAAVSKRLLFYFESKTLLRLPAEGIGHLEAYVESSRACWGARNLPCRRVKIQARGQISR